MQVPRAPGSRNRIPDSNHRVPRLCNHAPMQYAPKQFMITLPKSTNMSQHQFLKHQIRYLKFPTTSHTDTIHSTLHIQYSILQNIINKFNILESTQIIQTDRFNIHFVLIYKTTYIFCNSIICKIVISQ